MTQIQRLIVPGPAEPVSHYCHVVRAGNHVWVSGTVGVDKEGGVPDTTEDQFRLALENLDEALRVAGGGPEHIVKVTVYLTDVRNRSKINPLRQSYFGEHRPASTLVEVSALVSPALKVEIDAEAIVA